MKLLLLLLCHPPVCPPYTVNTFSAQSHKAKIIDEKSSVAVSGIFDAFRQTTHITANFSASCRVTFLSAWGCETLLQVTLTEGHIGKHYTKHSSQVTLPQLRKSLTTYLHNYIKLPKLNELLGHLAISGGNQNNASC